MHSNKHDRETLSVRKFYVGSTSTLLEFCKLTMEVYTTYLKCKFVRIRLPIPSEDHKHLHGLWCFTRAVGGSVSQDPQTLNQVEITGAFIVQILHIVCCRDDGQPICSFEFGVFGLLLFYWTLNLCLFNPKLCGYGLF